jgi:hypothetical protein
VRIPYRCFRRCSQRGDLHVFPEQQTVYQTVQKIESHIGQQALECRAPMILRTLAIVAALLNMPFSSWLWFQFRPRIEGDVYARQRALCSIAAKILQGGSDADSTAACCEGRPFIMRLSLAADLPHSPSFLMNLSFTL